MQSRFGEGSQGSGEGGFGEGSGRLCAKPRVWCRGRSGSTGFRRRFWRRSGRLWSRLRCFQRLASQHASEIFVNIKRCGCWGYHGSLFFELIYCFRNSYFKKMCMIVLCGQPLGQLSGASRMASTLPSAVRTPSSPPPARAATRAMLRSRLWLSRSKCFTFPLWCMEQKP